VTLQSQLHSATQGMPLRDVQAIIELGRKCFLAGVPGHEFLNPMKTDDDRQLWDKGWKHAQDKWREKQWKEREREREVV